VAKWLLRSENPYMRFGSYGSLMRPPVSDEERCYLMYRQYLCRRRLILAAALVPIAVAFLLLPPFVHMQKNLAGLTVFACFLTAIMNGRNIAAIGRILR